MNERFLIIISISAMLCSCAQKKVPSFFQESPSPVRFYTPHVEQKPFWRKPDIPKEPVKPLVMHKAIREIPVRVTPKKKRRESAPPATPFLRIATNTMAEEGVAMIRKRKIEEARDHFEKVINIDPSNPDAYYYLGIINFRKKHYRQSVLFFKKASSLYKGDRGRKARALYQIGIVYKTMRRTKQAAKYFKLSKDEDVKNAITDPLLRENRVL